MTTPLISFIVPAYNAARYIESCIGSICTLDMQGYSREVVVVNDGSTDDTAKIVEECRRRFGANLVIMTQENKGLSCARNAGMAVARGKYICFVDADDRLLNNTFPYNRLEDEDTDIVGYNVVRTSLDGSMKPFRRYKYRYEEVFRPASAFMKGRNLMPCVWAYMYRREFLSGNSLCFTPHIYHEDEDFTPRVFAMARSFVAVDVDFYEYMERENSITTTKDTRKQEWKLRDLVCILRRFHERSVDDEAFRCAAGCKMDYLAVDILTLLLRLKHSKHFRKEIVGALKEIGYFPLHWRWNLKYIAFNILTRYILR